MKNHDYHLGIGSFVKRSYDVAKGIGSASSVQPTLQCNKGPSLAHRFLAICETHADRISIENKYGPLSYHWLLCQSSRVAEHLLQEPNFRTGSRVGLSLPNSPEYVVAFFGIQLAGGVAVPLPHYNYGKRQQEHIELTQLDFLVAANNNFPKTILEKLTPVNLNARHVSSCCQNIRPMGRLSTLLFTSGSSGAAKAVMLSHQNILANTQSISKVLPLASTDRTLANMPFAHALGNSVLQSHILNGAALVFSNDLLFPTALLNALETYRCTSLIAVPEVYELLLRALGTDSLRTSRLRYFAVAGGRMNPDHAIQLAEQISPAEFFVMYGQTEATARLSCLPVKGQATEFDTIGKPIPGVEFTIRDKKGNAVTAGQKGTLFARGDNIMLGYWNDPKGTKSTISNGWLNTGDLAKKTKNGNYRLCGRQNGLVKIQGYRFHPNEIDQMLHGLMPDTSFVTIPVEQNGQTKLVLFVQPPKSGRIEAAELRQLCSRQWPRHMVPHLVEFVETWPVNTNKKTDRLSLAKQAQALSSQTQLSRSA